MNFTFKPLARTERSHYVALAPAMARLATVKIELDVEGLPAHLSRATRWGARGCRRRTLLRR